MPEMRGTLEDSLDLSALFARDSELRQSYVEARPWPHVVVTGAFPDDLLDRAAVECMAIGDEHFDLSRNDRIIKDEAPDGHGPSTQLLLRALDGPDFRSFLTQVTGIDDLVDDPTHTMAGVHRIPPGGFTKVHRDFPVHPTTRLHHRVNVLVYLNRDWPDSWGGALELWEPDMSAVGSVVAPTANTMVIFETDEHSLHGLPDPVTCPSDRARLSVASYFYTVEPGPDAAEREKAGDWLARPGLDSPFVGRFDRLRRATPRPVKRAFHAVRLRVRGQAGPEA